MRVPAILSLAILLGVTGVSGAQVPVRDNDGPYFAEHCWDVNCRKKDPACEDVCKCDGDNPEICTCLAVLRPPCETVCDKFCTMGTLEKAQ